MSRMVGTTPYTELDSSTAKPAFGFGFLGAIGRLRLVLPMVREEGVKLIPGATGSGFGPHRRQAVSCDLLGLLKL